MCKLIASPIHQGWLLAARLLTLAAMVLNL